MWWCLQCSKQFSIFNPQISQITPIWDFVEYFTDIQAWVPKNIVVVNTQAFMALDKETQDAVLAAAKAAETRGWEMSKQETAAKIAILKENGMKIITPSEALMNGLKETGASMLTDWQKDAGDDGAALLKAYK